MKAVHTEAKRKIDLYTDEGEHVGEIEYMKGGNDDLYAVRTEVFKGQENKGYGSALVDELAAFARERGMKITPICPFVKATFARHPEKYGDVMKL